MTQLLSSLVKCLDSESTDEVLFDSVHVTYPFLFTLCSTPVLML